MGEPRVELPDDPQSPEEAMGMFFTSQPDHLPIPGKAFPTIKLLKVPAYIPPTAEVSGEGKDDARIVKIIPEDTLNPEELAVTVEPPRHEGVCFNFTIQDREHKTFNFIITIPNGAVYLRREVREPGENGEESATSSEELKVTKDGFFFVDSKGRERRADISTAQATYIRSFFHWLYGTIIKEEERFGQRAPLYRDAWREAQEIFSHAAPDIY